MKISIQTLGTRGDVQPFIALGLELKRRGHSVVLSVPMDFREWVESFDLKTRSISVDMGKLLRRTEELGLTRNPLAAIFHWKEVVVPMVDAVLHEGLEGASGMDIIIAHPKMFMSSTGAEAAGALFVTAAPLPIIAPTKEWPMPATFAQSHGSFWNRLSWLPLNFGLAPYKKKINPMRQELGLSKIKGKLDHSRYANAPALRLIANSHHVIPRPCDWDEKVSMTGYWPLPQSKTGLNSDLEAFLRAGDAPVYIGFGSMVSRDATRLAKAAVAGLKRARLRGVISKGWADLPVQSGKHVHVIESAPHDILFPRCKALVHHGGAGTTGAALRAGKPSLIVPFMVDQPWWAERLKEQKLGPAALNPAQFTAHRFSRAIKAVISNKMYLKNCQNLSVKLEKEDGICRAVDLIEKEANLWASRKQSC